METHVQPARFWSHPEPKPEPPQAPAPEADPRFDVREFMPALPRSEKRRTLDDEFSNIQT